MMFASLLLLAAATIPGPASSPLAEDGHAPEWVEVFADDEGTLWVDTAWKASRDVDGVELPLFLMRTEMTLEGEPPILADLAMAVDCKNNQMGIAGAWTEAEGANLEGTEWLDDIEMDFTEGPLDEDDIALFRVACGPSWQP